MKITLDLTELEAGFLNAAVVDFFHKMKTSEENPTITWVSSESYLAARQLWDKVEAVTHVGEWNEPSVKEAGVQPDEGMGPESPEVGTED